MKLRLFTLALLPLLCLVAASASAQPATCKVGLHATTGLSFKADGSPTLKLVDIQVVTGTGAGNDLSQGVYVLASPSVRGACDGLRWSVTSSAEWLTVSSPSPLKSGVPVTFAASTSVGPTNSGGQFIAKAAANTGAARSATLTLTVTGGTGLTVSPVTVVASQAGQ